MSFAKVVANGISKDGTVSIELSTKEKLQDNLHHSWSRKEAHRGPVRAEGRDEESRSLISYTI